MEERSAVGKIAEELRERREERGLTAQAVREQLGIPLHYLEAMEGRGAALIADDFYLIPYLRRYAEFLELNPGTVVARFLAESAAEAPRSSARPQKSTRTAWIVAGIAAVVVAVLAWLALA